MTGVILPAVQPGVQPSVGAPGRCLCSTGPPLTPSLSLLYLEQGPGRTREGSVGTQEQGWERWCWTVPTVSTGLHQTTMENLYSPTRCPADYDWQETSHASTILHYRLQTLYCIIHIYCKLFIGSQLSKLKWENKSSWSHSNDKVDDVNPSGSSLPDISF